MTTAVRHWQVRVAAATALALVVSFAPAGHAEKPAARAGVAGLTAKSTGSGGQVTLSGWATFSGGVIASGTSPVGDAGPTGGPTGADLIAADVVYRPELADLFIRWQVASSCTGCGIPSVGTAPAEVVGDPTVLYGLRMTVAGTPVEVRVQSLGVSAQFGLFICQTETACTPGPSLQGGYGTTGEEVVVDLPLATLSSAVAHAVGEGTRISVPIAFTDRTPYDAGVVVPQTYLDSITTSRASSVAIPVKSVRVTVGHLTKTVALHDGYFSVSFPRSALPAGRTTTVTTRTCLGASCVVQRFSVKG